MSDLDKAAKAVAAAGRKVVAPDAGTASELAAKSKNIEEYNAATNPAPAKPVRFEPTPAEKVNSKAKFGSKPGENRVSDKELKDMLKPLGSYAKGTDRVPKTGVYKLHEGEAVIPAKENTMNPYDKVTEGAKKPKKVISEIRTRKAKSGGYIHEHHHSEPAHHKMEEHTTPDLKGMLEHMRDHMGAEGTPGEEKGESSATEAQEQAIGME